jgi:hypothetical protein
MVRRKEKFVSTAGQQLGVDMANNFMLMILFSLIADTAEDPDGFRTDVKMRYSTWPIITICAALRLE